MSEYNSMEDIARFTKEFTHVAQERGDQSTVDALHQAIARGGSQPSEILGELQLVFRSIKKEKAGEYPKDIVKEIGRAIKGIDGIFRQTGFPL